MKKRQAGFGTLEAIIIGLVVLALIGVGFWVYNKQSKGQDSAINASESVEAPTVPPVDTPADLQSVEQTLDNVNLEVGTSDNADLDAQTSSF